MLIQTFKIRPLLYGLGLAVTATLLGACAGTGPDTGTQDKADMSLRSTSAQNKVIHDEPQASEQDTMAGSDSGTKQGIDAVIKFAREVEIGEPGQLSKPEDPAAAGEAEDDLPQNYVFHFETDSVILSEDALREIEKHANYLRENTNSIVSVSGHADIRGSSEYNRALSLKRAHAVAEKLKQLGVAETQIMVASHGEAAPVVDEGNWGENRRVELEYLDDYMLSTR